MTKPILSNPTLISGEGRTPLVAAPDTKNPNAIVLNQRSNRVFLTAEDLDRLFDALDADTDQER